MDDNYEEGSFLDGSYPSTPESYRTGDGGSLPPSPRGRERIDASSLRRTHSADPRLDMRRKAVADVSSTTSGVVSLDSVEETQGRYAPHKPFGEMDVAEAWQTLANHDRLWFPLPIPWRDIPELEGCAVYFNKYPNFSEDRGPPDVSRIHAMEPGISSQNLFGCRANIKKIGPKLLQTLRRCAVPTNIAITETKVRIEVAEVPPVNPFPSHVLAIEQDPPIRGERCRVYIPIHDVVLLSFTSLIDLPPRLDPDPIQDGDKIQITVPIARFGIPNPLIFEKLVSYMYSALQTQDLMAMFDQHLGYAGLPENNRIEAASNLPRLLRLPFLKPEEQEQWRPWSKQSEGRLSTQLAMTYSYERLIVLMKDANLQFENITKIGLYDNVFEAGILLCRRLLLSAMTLSVVRHRLL
ncbi:hypothetical protein CPB86DRAFT_715022 [Serendipita vermifera]|nr:hypothetical protein CPB86DRAFT_715022 [Serendipita vermifera]